MHNDPLGVPQFLDIALDLPHIINNIALGQNSVPEMQDHIC